MHTNKMPEVQEFSNLIQQQPALLLLIMLPIIATVVGIARYIIGIKSMGIYAPVILTFSLYILGLKNEFTYTSDIWVGIKYGVLFISIVILTTIIGSWLIKKTRMHYFPKISIMLSLNAIIIILMLLIGQAIGLTKINPANSIVLIIIASVSEQFTSILFKKKLKTAIILTIETMIISIFCYVLIAWPSFQNLMIKYPYLIILTFLINYFIGKYRGLRFSEYFRFRSILNKPQEPKN